MRDSLVGGPQGLRGGQMASGLRTLLLVTVLVAAGVSDVPAQCLLMGEYESSPAPAYSCAFGVVDWSVSSWTFEDLGGGQISVTAVPGPLPVLLGSIDCSGLSFTAVGTVGGTCVETYTLTGQLDSGTEWSGTFTASYVGSCFDCTQQSWPVEGTAVRCLREGEYDSTPDLSYACAFNIVDFSVTTWVFTDLGGGQISVTPSPGPLPDLAGTLDCETHVFSVVGTEGGTCTETYTLTGEFHAVTSWTGDFTASFSGDCYDCTLQSWHLDSSVHTAVPEDGYQASWGTIKALYRGR